MLDVAEKKKPNASTPGPARRQVNARLPEEIARALERFKQSQRIPPDSTAVILIALREFLEREGFLP